MERKKKNKIAIVTLAVLLGLSLSALAGTLVYNNLLQRTPAAVEVPDNLITPDGNADGNTKGNNDDNTSGNLDKNADGSANGISSSAAPAQSTNKDTKKAATVELFNKRPEENTAFKAVNMFPGDSETKYFRVRVSYHDKVTVHYKTAVRGVSEKLAEVLRVRVRLLTTGETMYDGPIGDMPESLSHKLSSNGSSVDELYYEITAYLDTSVGNEYQNKDLTADFRWWVEEKENLDDSPKTGDTSSIILRAALAACSGGILFLLIVTRKRREDEPND